MLAVAALLFMIVLAIVFFWWRGAKKVPYCNTASWWPKAALKKKAVKAGRQVADYFKDNPGDTAAGWQLPEYTYWRAATGRTYVEWIYSTMVIEYLTEGGVTLPDTLPPCVFNLEGDDPVSTQLRDLQGYLEDLIEANPAMGTPKA
jgi:hypothetical protein